MKNNTINYILVGLVTLTVGLLIGLTFSKTEYVQSLGTSSAGSTFDTAKQASITVDLTQVASSSSILNTSSNDRYVTSIKAGCQSVGTSKSYVSGSGIASLQLTVATSSTASPITTNTNTNLVGNTVAIIGTSTPNFTIASGTANVLGNGQVNNIWASGSYMTFYNSATNTAQCTIGVDYFSS